MTVLDPTLEEFKVLLKEAGWSPEEVRVRALVMFAEHQAFKYGWPHGIVNKPGGYWPERMANGYRPGDAISIGEDYVRVQGDVRRAE